MSILRKHRKSNFTLIQNDILEDDRLSYRARGIAAYLLTKPDGWHISIAILAKAPDVEGEKAINMAMRELAVYGYMMRKRQGQESGGVVTITAIAEYPAFIDIGTPEERIQGFTNKPTPPDLESSEENKHTKEDGSLLGVSLVNTDQQDNISKDILVDDATASVVNGKKPPKVQKVKLPKKRRRKPIQLGQGSFGIDDVDTEVMEQKMPEHKEMFGLVCRILGWKTDLLEDGQEAQVGILVKDLRASGHTTQDLRDFWHKVWVNDWRWTDKHRKPTIKEIRAGMGNLSVEPPDKYNVVYGLVTTEDGLYVAKGVPENEFPSGKKRLTPGEVEYYQTPRKEKPPGWNDRKSIGL